jgi:hypothetical protein
MENETIAGSAEDRSYEAPTITVLGKVDELVSETDLTEPPK